MEEAVSLGREEDEEEKEDERNGSCRQLGVQHD